MLQLCIFLCLEPNNSWPKHTEQFETTAAELQQHQYYVLMLTVRVAGSKGEGSSSLRPYISLKCCVVFFIQLTGIIVSLKNELPAGWPFLSNTVLSMMGGARYPSWHSHSQLAQCDPPRKAPVVARCIFSKQVTTAIRISRRLSYIHFSTSYSYKVLLLVENCISTAGVWSEGYAMHSLLKHSATFLYKGWWRISWYSSPRMSLLGVVRTTTWTKRVKSQT